MKVKTTVKGGHDFGEIDWDEFWRVVKGHGMMNKDRISARQKAWDDGAWVRDAALAYAKKTASRAAGNTTNKADNPNRAA